MTKPKKKADRKKMGRPTAFKPEYIKQVKDLGFHGYTDKDLAGHFGVTEQTVNNWKQSHPDFFESLKRGKDDADNPIERSLFERAKGYSHKAVKIFCNAKGEVTKVDYTERFPPDPMSMIYWLNNRRPDKWRNRRVEDDTPREPLKIEWVEGPLPPRLLKTDDDPKPTV